MARSVGAIEVTVDADTSRLKAQLVKGGAIAGKEGKKAIEKELKRLEAEIDESGLLREARRAGKLAEKQIEASMNDIDVGFDIDIEKLIAEYKVGKERMEGDNILLDVALSRVSEEQVARRLRELGDDLRVQVIAELDSNTRRKVEAELQKIESDDLFVEIKADLDDAIAQAKLDQMEAQGRTIDFDVDIDTLAASQKLEIFRLKEELDKITLEIEVDRDKSDAAADAAGQSAGQAYSKGFGGGLFSGDDTKIIIAAVAAMGDAAGAALEGALSAATATVSSAVSAMGGAIGAVTPIVASFGATLSAVVVGSQGFYAALGDINEEFALATAQGRDFNVMADDVQAALDKLAPNARQTAIAFGNMRDELSEIRESVQDDLFADFDGVLNVLASTTVPDVGRALGLAADSANEFGKQLASVATNTDFEGMFRDLKPAVDDVFDAITEVVATFEPFIDAATPAAKRLADMLERGARALRSWVENNPDAIGDFLDDGIDSLEEWTRLLQRTGELLGTVFRAGTESGDTFVRKLGTIFERWDSFLKSAEGQNALADFFANGERAMASLQPVLEGVVDAFNILTTDSSYENFDLLAESVGRALPALAEILALLGDASLMSAIANILVTIGDLAVLLDAVLPDAALRAVTQIVVLTAAFVKVQAAIVGIKTAITAASKALALTSPQLLAIVAAASAAYFAMDALSGGTDQIAERSDELKNSLDGVADAMIKEAGAAEDAALAVKVLSDALATTGEDGDKLQRALGAVNKDITDTTDVLVDIGTRGVDALSELAQRTGLSAEAADLLAYAVNETDDNFKNMVSSNSDVSAALADFQDITGKTDAEVLALARSLEELQDQEEKTDFNDIIEQQFEFALGSDEVAESTKELIRSFGDLSDMAEGDVIAAYNQVLNAQAEAIELAELGAIAFDEYGNAVYDMSDTIARAEKAQQAWIAGIKEAGQEAKQAADDQERLAKMTEDIAVEMADAAGLPEELARGFVELGDNARSAASDADALRNSFDLLFGRALSADAAFDAFYQGINDVKEAMAEGEQAQVNYTQALFGTDEAALEFRSTMRDSVEGIMDFAAAQIEAGESTDVITQQVETMREALIAQADQMGLTDDEAREYINTLLGTPEVMSTLIETPGLFDALINAENLNLLYDEAGDPVMTEFEAIGLDVTSAEAADLYDLLVELGAIEADPTIRASLAGPTQAEVQGVIDTTEEINDTLGDPELEASDAEGVQRELDDLIETVEDLDMTTADPDIELSSYREVSDNLQDLIDTAEDLDETNPDIVTSLPGIDERISELQELKRAIDNLQSKTITITTRQNTIGGNMTGSIIDQEQITRVGERGLKEAIIPLELPLNQVNPQVRAMAALIRGQGLASSDARSTVASRTISPTFHIHEATSGEATAHRVMNRLSAHLS